jgi:hypothetical protein
MDNLTFLDLAQDALAVIGAIVSAGAVGAAAAWGLFVFFGQRWIENRFAKALAEFQSKKDGELEEIRHKINSLFSRTSKIHEKEFEVLSLVWRKLQIAYGNVNQLVSPGQSMPTLEPLSAAELDELLDHCEFPETAKERIRTASPRDREAAFSEGRSSFLRGLAHKSVVSFQNYVVLNGIFIPEDIQVELENFRAQLHRAIIRYDTGRQFGDLNMRQDSNQIVEELRKQFQDLRRLIQARLRVQEA